MSDLRLPVLAPSTWRERLGVCVVALVLTTVMTYPTIPHLTTAGRLGTSDGRFSIWNVAWVAHALTTDPTNLLNANIFHPAPGTLAYSELNLVAGVLGVPAYLATGEPLAAINSAIVIALLLCFISMWALVRRLSGSSMAGVVAATLFTWAPYVSARTAHIQLLMVFVFPLTVLAFLRMVERPSLRSGAGLGLALGVAALACGYYGLYLVLVVGILVLLFATRDAKYWIALGAGAVTTAAIVLPVLIPYLAIRDAAGGVARGWNPGEWWMYSASVRAYLTSGAVAHSWWLPALGTAAPDGKSLEVLFPGVIGLAAGVWGLVRARALSAGQRRWAMAAAVIAVLSVWASFGPDAYLYTVISRIPGMELLRAPARFGVLLPFGLAIGAGFAVAGWARGRVWVGVVLVVLSAAELRSEWPLDEQPPVPAAYRMLAQLPRAAAIEYPFPYRSSDFHNHSRAMLASTFHWQPMVNGYSDLSPAGFEELAGPVNAFPDPQSFELLRARHVRYVIWRAGEYNAEARAILEARFAPYEANLRMLTRDEDVWLYEIVSWPAGRRP